MYRADIRLVIGTRPEAIKLGPVAKALAAHGIQPSLILTGQHPELDLSGCGLDRFPAFSLGCAGTTDPHRYVEEAVRALLPFLQRRPDLVIVQGDTASALAGALAAVAAGVPLAHVEAGLRSHDLQQPWPEEEYRRRIDAEADLLFAPTDIAAENLHREYVRGAIHVTGNSGIDALMSVAQSAGRSGPTSGRFRILVTCHRRENWGDGLQSIADALRQLACEGGTAVEVVLHPNPDVSAKLTAMLGALPNLVLSPPCNQAQLIRKMLECDLMLSDSGGVQEEAPALGVPLLILRNTTERPEGIASGNARLVGLRKDEIVSAVRNLMADGVALEAMRQPAFPYGNGDAAPRIATHIVEWLTSHLGSHLLAS